jgi:UMP-CMP kinase
MLNIQLLENAMRDTLKSPPTFPADSALGANWQGGRGRFLIDGFPRKMDQAIKFDSSVGYSIPYERGTDEQVCASAFVLFISTTEEVMLERLMERGKTSGRDDDNVESIKKRFRKLLLHILTVGLD